VIKIFVLEIANIRDVLVLGELEESKAWHSDFIGGFDISPVSKLSHLLGLLHLVELGAFAI
jgi:hypothetical protein